jgi:hypothetical protein
MMTRSAAALAVILCSVALVTAQTGQGIAPMSTTSRVVSYPFASSTDVAFPSVDASYVAVDESESACPRWTTSAEYMLWWLKGNRPALPLLTTGVAVPAGGGGALGASDTTVLFRLADLARDGPYNGARFGLGYWIIQNPAVGLDASFFFLQKKTFTFAAGSDAAGSPLLSVPFFDLNPGHPGPGFSQVSVPDVLAGRMEAVSTTELWGYDVDLKTGLVRSNGLAVDGLLGFRHANLHESFGFGQTETALVGYPLLSFNGNPIPASDSLAIADSFVTRNRFYGCDLGLRTTWSPFSKVAVDLTTKIALGSVRQTLDVSGSTTHLGPGGTTVVESVPGGLFALWALNIGQFHHYRFAVLPEVALRLRYSLTEWLDVSVGYELIYLSSVVRPADQVSGTINSTFAPSQVPFGIGGPLAPPILFRRTDFTAQGLNVGFEVRF